MALLITGALPFMIVGSVLYYQNLTNRNESASVHASGANQAVSDAFSSVRVIQAYNLQTHVRGSCCAVVLGWAHACSDAHLPQWHDHQLHFASHY
jgi:hypothetical protein